jgi:hypothetical protein
MISASKSRSSHQEIRYSYLTLVLNSLVMVSLGVNGMDRKPSSMSPHMEQSHSKMRIGTYLR